MSQLLDFIDNLNKSSIDYNKNDNGNDTLGIFYGLSWIIITCIYYSFINLLKCIEYIGSDIKIFYNFIWFIIYGNTNQTQSIDMIEIIVHVIMDPMILCGVSYLIYKCMKKK